MERRGVGFARERRLKESERPRDYRPEFGVADEAIDAADKTASWPDIIGRCPWTAHTNA